MFETRDLRWALTRREAMGGAAAVGVLLAGGAAADEAPTATASAPTAMAQGIVFEDTDGSFRRTPASRGLPGVLVSNGRDVVRTGADGSWRLPVAEGDSVFVIKSTGWATPIDGATMLPRFAHLYEPEGTPAALGLRFHGVAPTGKLPESIDFPLRRQEEQTRFSAILFTDTQPETLAEVGYIRDDIVAQTAGVEAAFGITHGDIMFDDLSFYERYNRIVASIGLPWHNVCGNHDMNLESPDNAHSRETFKRIFGARYSAFQYGGATFFLLDNVDYLGTDPSKPNGFGKYRGFFGDRQLAFVRNVLAEVPRESLVVYSFHIPLKTLAGSDPATMNVDTADFLAAIASHPNSVSFAGHTHTNEHWYFGAAEGFTGGVHHHHVLSAVSGSWWSGPFDDRGIPVALASDGAPNGFHLLSVDGSAYRTRLVPSHDPARSQLRLLLDSQLHGPDPEVQKDYHAGSLLAGPIPAAAVPSTRLVANFFNGGPRSKVECSFGRAADFRPMQRTERTDPFVVEVYERNQATKKPWVQPGKSTHIWQASLPDDLAVGTHRVTVRASDEYGKEHVAWMVLEVTA